MSYLTVNPSIMLNLGAGVFSLDIQPDQSYSPVSPPVTMKSRVSILGTRALIVQPQISVRLLPSRLPRIESSLIEALDPIQVQTDHILLHWEVLTKQMALVGSKYCYCFNVSLIPSKISILCSFLSRTLHQALPTLVGREGTWVGSNT